MYSVCGVCVLIMQASIVSEKARYNYYCTCTQLHVAACKVIIRTLLCQF